MRALLFCLITGMGISLSLDAQEIDPDFKVDLFTHGSASLLKVQPDDKILVGGRFSFVGDHYVPRPLARLWPDGRPDTTFVIDPRIAPLSIRDIAVQPDGKILIGGMYQNAQPDTAGNLVRLHPDGHLDTSFYYPPKEIVQDVCVIEVLPNQKIAIISFEYDPKDDDLVAELVEVLLADGSPDPDFVPVRFVGEFFTEEGINGITCQSENEIIIYGRDLQLDTMLQDIYRVDSKGKVDTGFKPKFAPTNHSGIKRAVTTTSGLIGGLRNDGTVFILDREGNTLRNFTLDCCNYLISSAGTDAFALYADSLYHISADSIVAYEIATPAYGQEVYNFARQSDGSIIGVGNFREFAGMYAPAMFHLSPGDSPWELKPDPGFSPGLYQLGEVYDIQLLHDGKLLVAGNFHVVNGQRVNHIARLSAAGEVDTTFNLQLATESIWSRVYSLDTLSNGHYVIGSTKQEVPDSTRLSGLDIVDENGYVQRRITYPYTWSDRKIMPYLAIDGKDNIYAGSGGVYDIIDSWKEGRQVAKFSAEGQLLIDFLESHLEPYYTSMLYTGLILQPDDQVILIGLQLIYDGFGPTAVIRAEENGARDQSYDTDIPTGFQTGAGILLPDGSMLVSGKHTTNSDELFLYKLDDQGRIDPDFDFGYGGCNVGDDVNIEVLHEIAPGQILVCGWCQAPNSHSIDGTFRILIDETGRRIGDLLPHIGQREINTVSADALGRIYLAGQFTLDDGPAALFRTLGPPPTQAVSPILSVPLQLEIFPNPVGSGQLHLRMSENMLGKSVSYVITDIAGRTVASGQGMWINETITLPVSGLSRGVYILKINAGGNTGTARFVR